MDAPLGRAVGNALEVIECLEMLKGRGPGRSRGSVRGADGADADPRRRRARPRRRGRRVRAAIASGAGLERFRQIIENQGGDPRVVDDYAPAAVGARPARRDGAARRRASRGSTPSWSAAPRWRSAPDAIGSTDGVDPAVGIMVLAAPGARASRAGDPVLELHYRRSPRGSRPAAAAGAGGHRRSATRPPAPRPLIRRRGARS